MYTKIDKLIDRVVSFAISNYNIAEGDATLWWEDVCSMADEAKICVTLIDSGELDLEALEVLLDDLEEYLNRGGVLELNCVFSSIWQALGKEKFKEYI